MYMKKTISNFIMYIILILVSITMLVPFVWMFLTAFKTVSETMQIDPFVIIPKVWQVQNFENVIKAMDFVRLYANTLGMVGLRILFAVVTASLSGYAFARLNFKGKNVMFALVLFQMMIPVQLFIIPQYVMVSNLHLTNSIMGLVFPGIVSAFGTFLLRQAFLQLPRDLEEAARLDGCNIPQTFMYIMAPLTRSAMVALGIFTAVFAYKDLMWPMIVAPDNRATTLASALAKMNGQYQQKYPELMMAALISCVPMIILYIIFQKQFIEGIATSGGKL
ncbi:MULTISPECIES: carbohydrate ABC transporter permease [Pseudobutyrivibrio]|uniref:Carbohydrate ABC transporter permease n=2 Tax=Pseudobutyrivibrio TaxID=46205 RepID=A0A2G3DY29_9FIRM|nr:MULTISPECIES: carbohydrate ABC transporter permease [Pseudobutyrivibrio]MBE5904552.1 carbohydrate ABC transporter permease [Pseudobutyrivibrio sp.]NEX02580.1 carbohydrate ABC transporter permease [Pseudobutyrivibrio xylanivorans]PHU35780.1 carbohydrate ABC transporter permease [Pseudobutyrivibrio ruminis]